MPHQLPDEVLAMIIGYCVVPHDAVFSHSCAYLSSYRSIRSIPRRPSPNLVLVCKRWMRVGTRLLYHTVILRNRQQVDALATTLKANPAFSRFVCKLRVDRGFGSTLAQVLDATRGSLREVCFSLDFPATDKPEVIGGRLAQLQLRRLVLVYGGAGEYIAFDRPKNHIAWLGANIAESMFAWPNLTSITLHTAMLSEHTGIYLGVIVSQSLREVQLRVSDLGVGTRALALTRKVHAPRILIVCGYSEGHPSFLPKDEEFYDSLPAKARAKLAFEPVVPLEQSCWRKLPPPPPRPPRRKFWNMPSRSQERWRSTQYDFWSYDY